MDDGDAFSLNWVDNYISVYDGGSLVKEKNVSALHGRFHTTTEDDNDWTLCPKAQFEDIPDHDSWHDNDAEAESLVENLQPEK